jgi:hypothetical protein
LAGPFEASDQGLIYENPLDDEYETP